MMMFSLSSPAYCGGVDVTTIGSRPRPSWRSGKELVGFIDQIWLGVFRFDVHL